MNRSLFSYNYLGCFELKLADFIFEDFVFYENAAAYYLTMGPKKGRRVRKLEVPTESVPKFELGDTAADIQWRRQEREATERVAREREVAEQQQQREEDAKKEEERVEKIHSEQKPRTEKSDSETKVVGGEAGPSQSRYKKGHITNIYLTDPNKKVKLWTL